MNEDSLNRSSGRSPESSTAEKLVHYVVGEMPMDERVEFEVRMSDDDELGQAVGAAARLDELLFVAARYPGPE